MATYQNRPTIENTGGSACFGGPHRCWGGRKYRGRFYGAGNCKHTLGVAKLSPAFVARYQGNRGAPNLGVIVEYDALRGTKGVFHGDPAQHPGPIGLAVAVAMAEWLAKSGAPGRVVIRK
jgi:metal-dependent amidase/aminoacylase/carboxypeptidase family protein